jgi:hypothetical protein
MYVQCNDSGASAPFPKSSENHQTYGESVLSLMCFIAVHNVYCALRSES